MAGAANPGPALWGDRGLWFAVMDANTVWRSCQPSFVVVGAAGPTAESTKRAVDVLIDVLAR